MWRNQNLYILLVRMHNGAAALENNPQKLKHLFSVNCIPHDTEIPFLGICPREMKTYVHSNLYVKVHSSIIHNSPKWKEPKCPTLMSKENVVHPYS